MGESSQVIYFHTARLALNCLEAFLQNPKDDRPKCSVGRAKPSQGRQTVTSEYTFLPHLKISSMLLFKFRECPAAFLPKPRVRFLFYPDKYNIFFCLINGRS